MCDNYTKKIELILAEQLKIEQQEFPDIAEISKKIIHSFYKNQELAHTNWFNFSYLYKLADCPSNQNIFYKSVYLLANPRVNFITQNFHYFDETLDMWQDYPNDLYYIAITDKEYIHPVYQKEITYEEFLNTVVPYFSLTNESLNIVSNCCGK
ncbi:TPA: hypothetical protein PEV06_001664 [Acinetobacter baumannii]|uniref:hypothetical protein n=1 Tax=Acinetobacter baumannii TaxID=470 RepID=UPI001FD6713C|nr:hypothetical protein [Acinetobacter baumannii]MDC5062521.1 hypothetical protein [Acinetobacter baumannii]HCH8074749.1 hypothetical protein [Acinetobacter baumannii]HDF7034936.1 hypothetical protein [Acinetobacter baumannii]